jgi:hypothetical protein
VAEYYILAAFYVEIAHLFEFGQEYAVQSHLIFKSHKGGIAIRIDSPS